MSGTEERRGRSASLGRPALVWLFAPFALGYFCSYFFRNINAVVGPRLAVEFGLGPRELGLLTSTYFLTFAAAQIPIGMALDRFGPNRVSGVLLLCIASGAVIFGFATNLGWLTLGRALLGIGAAGMLMAALSAVPVWSPRHRIATYMGIVTAVGGTGAIAAATPVQVLVEAIGWRNTFLVGGIFAALLALLAFGLARWSRPGAADESIAALLNGVREIFATPRFWSLGVASAVFLGTFLAFQSLWAATWLRDAGAMEPAMIGDVLIALNVGMIAAFLTCGLFADQLLARGIQHITTVKLLIAVGFGAQAWIMAAPQAWPHASWALYSYCANSMLLLFAIVGREFDPSVTGRLNTCLNLVCFSAAFATQGIIGAVLDLFPATLTGYDPRGYYAAWGGLLVVQIGALAWMHRCTGARVPVISPR